MFSYCAPPASSPAPRRMARSMLSFGTELFLAFWIASNSVGLPAGSPPPVRAATSTFLISLANSLPRLASTTAFLCLVVAHLEWPLMTFPSRFEELCRTGSILPPCSAGLFLSERVVHLEERGRGRVPGQLEHLRQGPPPGLDRARGHVVVELAGEEDLVRGGLKLADELLGAIVVLEGYAELFLAERRPQGPGQVALGQVPGLLALLGAAHRVGQQHAGGRVEELGGGQLVGR